MFSTIQPQKTPEQEPARKAARLQCCNAARLLLLETSLLCASRRKQHLSRRSPSAHLGQESESAVKKAEPLGALLLLLRRVEVTPQVRGWAPKHSHKALSSDPSLEIYREANAVQSSCVTTLQGHSLFDYLFPSTLHRDKLPFYVSL